MSPVELRIEKESKEAVAWLVPLSQRNTNTKTKMMPTGYYYSRTASVCLLKMSLILLEKSNIFFEHYIRLHQLVFIKRGPDVVFILQSFEFTSGWLRRPN